MDEDLLNGYPEEQLWFVRTSSADRPAIQVPIPPPKRQTLLWALWFPDMVQGEWTLSPAQGAEAPAPGHVVSERIPPENI